MNRRPLTLEVITLYRGTVLDVCHLEPGQRFTVGPDEADLPLDHPALAGLGQTPYAVAAVDGDGNARIDPVPGCPTTVLAQQAAHPVEGGRGVRLVPGQKARVDVGDTSLLFALVHAAPEIPRAPISLLDRDGRRFMGAAAALHAVLLALAFTVPVQAGSLNMDGLEREERWVEFMDIPLEQKPEEAWTEALTEEKAEPAGAEENAQPNVASTWPEPKTRPTETGGEETLGDPEAERARQEKEAIAAADQVGDLLAGLGPGIGETALDALNGLHGDAGGDPLALGGNLKDGLSGVGVRPGTGGGPSVGPGRLATRPGKDGYGRRPSGSRIPKKPTRQPPEIIAGEPDVAGGLSRDEVQRVVRRNRNAVRHCYEKALQSQPDMQGKVRTKFVVGADGRVLTAAIVESTLGDRTVEQCIASRVQRMQFPAVRGGGAVVVTYPFMFRASR